jgi:hypothetical protein
MADTLHQIEQDLSAALECTEVATRSANELVGRTSEGERASISLLLRDAPDLVVTRVIDGHVSVQLHSQPVG